MNTGKTRALLLIIVSIVFAVQGAAYAGNPFTETVTPFPIPKGDAMDRQVFLASVIVSPDSKHIAYVARNAGKYFTVVDGKERTPYETIGKGTPIFTPDSKDIVYRARRDGKWFIVQGSKEMKAYKNVSVPIMSPDSKRMAYVALEEGKDKDRAFVVLDGKEDRAYDNIVMKPFSLVFSRDGS
ncbi:MAG TPA: hypothetical protein PLF54_12015, partial [Deltaproteobacteria bacterium]|nr:hypothetical protein [Deltaproteobacteria bacterium]